MSIDYKHFNLLEHCHVNTNKVNDRFVGVKIDSNNPLIYFPLGYELPKRENDLKRDIKNLFNVLAIFTDKTDRVIHMEEATKSQQVEFPIQAYLNVINYYFDHNGSYYSEIETTYKINNKGKINWTRTIKTQTPMVQGKSMLYLNPVVRVSTSNFNRLITKIYKYCVYESFNAIGWLYTINKPEQPDILLDKKLFISTLNAKLSNTNNDNDKKLFRSMIAIINFIDEKTINKQFYYGTDKFEMIWEKLIDNFFGENNKKDYFPHGLWTEKKYGLNKEKPVSALEPDSIMIYNGKYYVLDAKYYQYGVSPESGLNALPKSSDINKQITYGKFVKNRKAKNASVFNAFIMPFNMSNNKFNIDKPYGLVAEATGDWINDPNNPKSYELIQGIVIDTKYLLKNYDGNHNSDKEKLSLIIENGSYE